MDEILIIDDAIPKDDLDKIENLVSSFSFPWFYQRSSTYESDDKANLNLTKEFLTNAVDTPVMTHVLWRDGANSEFVNNFVPITQSIPNIDSYKVVRCQVNLTFPSPKCNENNYSFPHTDLFNLNKDYMTAICYLNDCTGDTFIFNEEWGHFGKLTVKQRITPKRGRLVVFNGKQLHAGNNPLGGSTSRFVVNVNLVKKPV